MLRGMVMQLENESNVSPPQAQHVLAGQALRALLRLICQIRQQGGADEGMEHIKNMLKTGSDGQQRNEADFRNLRNKLNVAIMDARHISFAHRSVERAAAIIGSHALTGLSNFIRAGCFEPRISMETQHRLGQLVTKLSSNMESNLDESDLTTLKALRDALRSAPVTQVLVSMDGQATPHPFQANVTVKTCLERVYAVLADCVDLPPRWTCVNPTLSPGGCALIKHTILALEFVTANTYSRPSEIVLGIYKLLLDIPATAVQLGHLAISEPRLRQSALEFAYWTVEQREDYLNRIGIALSGQFDAWMKQENSPAGQAQLRLIRVRPSRLHTWLSERPQTSVKVLQHQALGKLLYDETLEVGERKALRTLADQMRDPEDSACLAFLLIRADKLSERATS